MKAKIKLLACLLASTALLFILGCSTQLKEINKLHGLNLKYPNELAKDCAEKFPVKDSVGVAVITTAKADNKNYQGSIDSLQQLADNLKQQINSTSYTSTPEEVNNLKNQVAGLTVKIAALRGSYKPCKPDTIKIQIPHYLENTALVKVLQNNLDAKGDSLIIVKTQLKASQEDNAGKRKWLFILGAALLAGTGIGVWKFFKV